MKKLVLEANLGKLKTELLADFRSLLDSDLTTKQNKSWLTEKEAREFLDISKSTLQSYRKNLVIPFSQFKGKIYFKHSDLEQHLSNNYSRRGGHHE
ncbi:MAG: helix-turn-helix domain-containing protein [Chitinophagales bacterium]